MYQTKVGIVLDRKKKERRHLICCHWGETKNTRLEEFCHHGKRKERDGNRQKYKREMENFKRNKYVEKLRNWMTTRSERNERFWCTSWWYCIHRFCVFFSSKNLSVSPLPHIPDSSSILLENLLHKRKLGPAVSESIGFLVVCQGSFYSLSLLRFFPLLTPFQQLLLPVLMVLICWIPPCKTDICLPRTTWPNVWSLVWYWRIVTRKTSNSS